MQNHDEIDRTITEWTKQFSSSEVKTRLSAVGIGADCVRRINDVIDAPDAPTVFAKMAERRVGSMLTTKLPFTLSFVDLPAPQSAPSLGEHSVDVLREWLNCSESEIEALEQQEVLK
jgi:crotonobetainyl-CoA:carnitine CoA-transferase CaiB-like acyl-CoA transferase